MRQRSSWQILRCCYDGSLPAKTPPTSITRFSAAAEINLFFDVVEVASNEGINANLIRVSVGSPTVSDEFGYNAVIFAFAGFGTVFSKIVILPSMRT